MSKQTKACNCVDCRLLGRQQHPGKRYCCPCCGQVFGDNDITNNGSFCSDECAYDYAFDDGLLF